MAKYSSKDSTVPTISFPAPQANPNSANWKAHTNCSVLRDREFPPKKAPSVETIKNPPPLTPVAKRGTLAGDDGNGAYLKTRAKSDKGSFPS